MFRFFRKIRLRLLTQNQVSRYLLYALGEIILIVIGIMIALQLDNYNEQQKRQDKEITALKDLRSDLQETLRGLRSGKSLNQHTLIQYRYLMEAIDTDASYSVKIDSALAWLPMFHVPIFTRTAYESLKSQGIDLITNDSLKKQVASLYEYEFLYLIEDQSRLEWSLHSPLKSQFINRYLRYKDGDDIMVHPVDFERIKSDEEFINLLSSMIAIRGAGLRYYDRNIEGIRRALQSIDQELISLNK